MISRPSLRALRDRYALLHCELQVRASRYSLTLEQDYFHTVSWLNQISQLCEGNRVARGFFGLAPNYSVSQGGIEASGEANLDTWSDEFRSMVSEPGRSIASWSYESSEEALDFLHDTRLRGSGIRAIGATRKELVLSSHLSVLPEWVNEYSGTKTVGSHW